ncbi:MAG: glycosyltransferase family 2 protein [Acidobacteria bacterium]|nr:glycosyltransferase family 2 protein [Acidobacteriota bacterium]MCA1610997.1 glycosyltransferase family 2 protein [Acidobacteriota bacterium]
MNGPPEPRRRPVDVAIIVVSYNDAADLPISLASALAQRGVSREVLLVDNASADGSRAEAARLGVRVVALPENTGFAAAMNAGIDATESRYVLALNPDCRLEPDFAATIVARMDARPDAGSASGRLLRGDGPDLRPSGVLDSAGIVFRPSGRHFDRGAGEPAAGRYEREEEIEGASGAAGLYRRDALGAARISTGFFDADFFLYREDADLAWRLRNLGWRCLYVPGALAYHRRRNLPERRRQMTAAVNLHSVKNRFLLRINNQSGGDAFRTLLPTLARDLLVIGACLTVERSSLPAFRWLWQNRKRLWSKRREIQTLPRLQGATADS